MTLTKLGDYGDQLDVFTPAKRNDTDSWIEVVANVSKLAAQVAETEFVPGNLRGKTPAVAGAILYGREIGLPPMTALTQINVIDGRPGISAEGMRSLVYAAGHDLVFEEASSAVCRIRARRSNSQSWTSLEWTIDQARQAKLTHKDNWGKYPRAMLVARCTTDICRMVFPDVIHGFRSFEELDDISGSSEVSPSDPSRTRSSGRTVQRRRSSSPVTASPSDGQGESSAVSNPNETPALPGEDTPPVTGGAESTSSAPPEDVPADTPADVPADVPAETREDAREDTADPVPRVNKATQKIQMMQFKRLGIAERDERLHICSTIIGRDLSSSWDETPDEASQINIVLSVARDIGSLWETLSATTSDDAETLPLEGTADPEKSSGDV